MYLISITKKKIVYFFTKKKYVIIWNDHSEQTSEKICAELEKKTNAFKYVVIGEPKDILFYPIGVKYVQSIMFFITDVTKLSEKPKERDKIQLKILNHLKREGAFLGTHDIIYRRMRNDALEKAFGCQTNNFKRLNKPVEAFKTKKYYSHPLLKDIPDEFSFDDGEVCWGEWVPDAKILIQTKIGYNNRKKIPLLVTRKVSFNGLTIWLNSGDKFIDLPKSISEPEDILIQILANSLNYLDEIKNY
ncbi:MAG: hypothetical protein IIB06_04385 [Bacteroidetes bacterium]|nr:hypothetical protein [Bacteroidota bacterium]